MIIAWHLLKNLPMKITYNEFTFSLIKFNLMKFVEIYLYNPKYEPPSISKNQTISYEGHPLPYPPRD